MVVHRPKYDDWSWPKGKLDRGETLPACAIREVAEETGKQVVLGQPLPTLRYPSGGRTKVVKYWAAHVAPEGTAAVRARPAVPEINHDEVDKVRWLTVDQARERITFKDDLRPLEVLVNAYERDRLETRAFVLVRHARAKRRKAWRGDDLTRPITKAGERRAHQLVALFAAFGVKRIDSSPAERCHATVKPYAQAAKVTVKTHDSLTEHEHESAPLATARTFTALLAKRSSRVVSVHRPTLPTIVEMVRAATRSYTRGALPRKNPYLPAGGVLVAHVLDTDSGPRVTAIETHLLQVHP